jgi:hypothetical protein
MAISRPVLLALLGAALLGATYFAVQNARDSSAGDSATAGQRTEGRPEAQNAAQTLSPEETLARAFSVDAIDSTSFSAKLSFGARGRRAAFDLSGAYEKGAAGDIPEVEFNGEVRAAGRTVQGGFVSLGDRAYFTRGSSGWQVPEEVWTPLADAVAKGAGAGQAVSLPIHPERWAREVKTEGTETIDGVETTHVSASIDPKRVVRDLGQAARQNGAAVPGGARAARAVKRAELDAWVGADDHVVRRLTAQLAFAGSARSRIDLDLTLKGVNQPQDIAAPAKIHRGLPSGEFGQLAKGFVTGLAGLGVGRPVSVAALTSDKPRRAARAVRAGKKVVILFENPKGLDDRAMGGAMRELAHRTKAFVLTDNVDAVGRYGQLVEDVGVSQTPSIVIIDRAGHARLIEGYVDVDTLAQSVADSR